MKMKKMVAMCLVVGMVFSMVACTNQKSNEENSASGNEEVKKDPVILKWYYGGVGVQRDTEIVEAAFNELLHSYKGMEHVSVDLNTSANKEYANAFSLAQSAGQQIDIIQTYRLDFAKEIANGTFLAMNDLLEKYPNLKNEFPEWIWEMGSYENNIYVVPCYQRAANIMYFVAPKEYVDNYGDAEEFRQVMADPASSVEDYAKLLEKWIVKVQAGEGSNKYLWPIAEYYTKANDYRCFAKGYDSLTGTFILGADEDQVDNIYTTDEIVKAYEISADWYEKGYVFPDIVSVTDFAPYEKANMMNEEAFIYYMANGIGDEQMMSEKLSKQYGFDVYAFPLGGDAYVANVWAAGGNGIYAKSEHPEEAMRLLELLNTEEGEKLYNILIYGIEGTHYTKVDDTHITTTEYDGEEGGANVSFAGKKWLLGNTKYAWINQGGSDEMKALGEELNVSDRIQISKLAGFIADTSKVENQLSQVATVVSEYAATLKYGVMGKEWETTYNDFLNKMEIAGYSEIINEMQSQVDAFLKK